MTDYEKEYIYDNYLYLSNKQICETLDITSEKLASFLNRITVPQMMDKMKHLKGEGYYCNINLREINQINRQYLSKNSDFEIEYIDGVRTMVIQSKLNYNVDAINHALVCE